jgi:23S rRNA pseudouridine1911/1915/1917 synthase
MKIVVVFYQNRSYKEVKMPFVKEKFLVPEPMPAFIFIMRTFGFSQAEAQRLICKGRLLINGESMIATGRRIEGEVEIVHFKPSSRNNPPLFQTRDFMVFEKPSGELVHPNTMATEYSILDEIRTYAGEKANATHRIDMETSGLLLASKHKEAERYLKGIFEQRKIEKSYLAWVDGKLDNPFSVSEPIKVNQDYSQSKHKVSIDPEGKSAHTDFKPLQYDAKLDATLLGCYPHTGRTHQIRIHLFHVKHPILGDPIYGTTFEAANRYLDQTLSPEERCMEMGAERLLLHAHTLRFHYGAEFFIESKMDFEKEKYKIALPAKRAFNKKAL